MSYTPFNRWIGFMLLNILAGYFLYQKEIFSLIISSDLTYISIGVIIIYVLTSMSIGFKTFLHCHEDIYVSVKLEWFVRSELAALGLIGTIIGLMFVLGPTFAGINPQASETITKALSTISLGVGTALWTTITALTGAVLLGVQLMNLEHSQDDV